MKHGQGQQQAVPIAYVHGGYPAHGRPADGLVGVYHALGQAGGAGGVHDEEVVVAAGGDLGLGVRGLLQQRPQPGVVAIRGLHLYPGLHRHGMVGTGLDPGGQLGAFRAVDHGFGAAVGDDEREFAGGEPRIHRHHHGAQFGGAIKQPDELHAVGHQQCHPVPRLQATGRQHPGAAVGQGVHPGVVQARFG